MKPCLLLLLMTVFFLTACASTTVRDASRRHADEYLSCVSDRAYEVSRAELAEAAVREYQARGGRRTADKIHFDFNVNGCIAFVHGILQPEYVGGFFEVTVDIQSRKVIQYYGGK